MIENRVEFKADFDTAIMECGIGLFNVLLIFGSVSSPMCTIFTMSLFSFIYADIECDFHIDDTKRGRLSAISFAGMITAALMWGYLGDIEGRKPVLVIGLLLDSAFVLACSLSQSYEELMSFKFFDGFFISGPGAVVMTYVAEFYTMKHRPIVILIMGMTYSIASAVIALAAFVMLPRNLSKETPFIHLYSWNFFLMVFVLPPFIGGIFHIFLPESPKYLMAQGYNDKALECMKSMYHLNKQKPKENYPFNALEVENEEKLKQNNYYESEKYKEEIKIFRKRMVAFALRFLRGMKQLKPLLIPPYLWISIQVYSLHFCTLFGVNTIRLWLPQLFTSMSDFENNLHRSTFTMCEVLEYNNIRMKNITQKGYSAACKTAQTLPSGYMNNIIVAVSTLIGFIVAALLIQKIGTKTVMMSSFAAATVSAFVLYFSNSSKMTLAFTCIYLTFGSIAGNCNIAASVTLFPTNVRTMVVVMLMTSGRLGSLLGNLIFPYLTRAGCLPPFIVVSIMTAIALVLAGFLPAAKKPPKRVVEEGKV